LWNYLKVVTIYFEWLQFQRWRKYALLWMTIFVWNVSIW
jgi:hypothetical protein